MTNAFSIQINDLGHIKEVIELSKEVFQPSPDELGLYHDQDDWVNKINNNGLLITARDNGGVIGFAICYVKDENTFHIWNTGVSADYRGRGIWKKIFKEIEAHARKKGFARLTLNTYEKKFPVMYRFALNNGFQCNKKEMHDKVEKSFFEKLL